MTSKRPPTPATYKFRYTGTLTVDPGQPDQKVTLVPDVGVRQVTGVTSPSSVDGSFSFSVIETFNGYQQTNTYIIYPEGHAPNGGSSAGLGSPDAGIYLQSMSLAPAGQPTAPSETFNPEPPIQIMAFPAVQGATFQGAGTDPINQTTMTVEPNSADPNSGIVRDRVRVDACGTVLQAWEADLAGSISQVNGKGTNQTYRLVLDFATEYGGLSIRDHLVLHDTDPKTGKPQTLDLTATIDQEPRLPS